MKTYNIEMHYISGDIEGYRIRKLKANNKKAVAYAVALWLDELHIDFDNVEELTIETDYKRGYYLHE